MWVVIVHNRYRYRGGQDESSEAEETLRQQGYDVRWLSFDNGGVNKRNAVRVAIDATWRPTS